MDLTLPPYEGKNSSPQWFKLFEIKISPSLSREDTMQTVYKIHVFDEPLL